MWLPQVPGVEPLLERLKQVGAVSSYSESNWKREFKVHMRHE